MPKQTFFNLSDSKRERIVQSAKNEFSEKSLSEASIANIVKEAGISRGSYYQYFEDKNDLFFYIIGLFRANYHQLIIQSLEKNDGDFFIAFKQFGNKYISDILVTDKFGLFENLYLHMSEHINRAQGYHPKPLKNKDTSFDKSGEDFIKYVDFQNLRVEKDSELLDIFKFIIGILNDTVMEGYWRDLSIPETQEIFQKRLSWIFYGVFIENKKEGDV